jgi:hypothetical protein
MKLRGLIKAWNKIARGECSSLFCHGVSDEEKKSLTTLTSARPKQHLATVFQNGDQVSPINKKLFSNDARAR